MGIIRHIETREIVFESSDPSEVLAKSNELVKAWNDAGNKGLPFMIEGFDSVELESGEPYPNRADDGAFLLEVPPPPEDTDRLVVNEEHNTITVYGNAEPPPNFDGEIIEAR